MNLLLQESSPYLLQHANNPVFWKAWNANSLASAKNNNKLIIVSIGYASCHWCHVMEKECFEDEEVAKVMNSNFVSIKVDKEERPDIDAIYMKALQILTKNGGWPLNMVCLPNGKPFWGCTYLPKSKWINALENINEIFNHNPDKLYEYANNLTKGIQQLNTINVENSTNIFSEEDIHSLVEKWKIFFDEEFGANQRAPKFMMPVNIDFLLAYSYYYKNQEILNHVSLTLTKMAWGGIFDVVEGGFSRYSVDVKWHIPHFEKMLYDNALLISTYANAYKHTKNTLYLEVIEKTILFCEQNLLTNNNCFYSSLDADSLNKNNTLQEGAFYVWTKDELSSILKDDFLLFSKIFNINEFGFWEEDFYVLIQNDTLENIAKENNISIDELKIKKTQFEKKLYSYRKKRQKPLTDTKCITAWNALMLKAYVNAFEITDNIKYLEKAENLSNYFSSIAFNETTLFRSYTNQKLSIDGFLDDYALVIEAFIALYTITFNQKYILFAKQLTDHCLDNFYDDNNNLFRYTSMQSENLVAIHYETEDNVIPSSNAVMANNLYTLGTMFYNSHYINLSKKIIEKVLPIIDYAGAYAYWLTLWLKINKNPKELAICGENALNCVRLLTKDYYPNILFFGSLKDSNIPILSGKFEANKTLFYLCENYACSKPETSINEIINQLKNERN